VHIRWCKTVYHFVHYIQIDTPNETDVHLWVCPLAAAYDTSVQLIESISKIWNRPCLGISIQLIISRPISCLVRFFSPDQGCQMVCFQTKNPNLGKFWGFLQWKIFVYFMTIWSILRTLEIFYGHLVHFVVIWYISPRFGNLYQEKSGNPDRSAHSCYLNRGWRGPGAYGRVGLDPDGVDGVRHQLGHGGQLVVVHELGLPLGQVQARVRRVVDLVALKVVVDTWVRCSQGAAAVKRWENKPKSKDPGFAPQPARPGNLSLVWCPVRIYILVWIICSYTRSFIGYC
jgi:hypothetical protein